MKRLDRSVLWVVALGILVLGPLVALPAVASGASAKSVQVEGWVVDEWCGKANANPGGKDCTLECYKKGSALVLVTDDKVYKLKDQKSAVNHVGHKVRVKGTLEGADVLAVAEFAKADAAKKADAS